jgi:hypothetical protein
VLEMSAAFQSLAHHTQEHDDAINALVENIASKKDKS